MKYKIQEHEVKTKEYRVYKCAPNGELCQFIAACNTPENAKILLELLEDKDKQ